MARAKMGASHGWNGNYVESATASFSLAPGDSGKTFILKDADVTVTLPALSDINAGYQVTIISGDGAEHAVDGGATVMQGYNILGDAAAGAADTTIIPIAAKSSLTLTAGAAGDKLEFISDGVNWYSYSITADAVTQG